MQSSRPPTSAPSRIAVVGSLNIDHFARVESLPRPGETVRADRVECRRGGKGGNQAIAAARQGCQVVLYAALGADEDGLAYLQYLKDEGLLTEFIRTVPDPTGAAYIAVDPQGENTIIVSPGANERLSRSDILTGQAALQNCDALLVQFEVSDAPILTAIHLANQGEIPVIVNPSPIHPLFPWEEVRTDYLITNESEAADLLGLLPHEAGEEELLERMRELRTAHWIVTRGGDDTLVYCREAESFSVPVLSVLPVDTVGAGDAFAGCFAACIARGASLEEAVRAANCAGALTTLGAGAQEPIPEWEEVERHLQFLPQRHGHVPEP